MAFIFVYYDTNAGVTQKLAQNSFYFIIPTALFLVSLFLFINRFTFAPSLGGAYGVWIASLLMVNRMLGIL